MSDLWAARQGDALLHTSVMADILGGVLEVAANIAIVAAASAAVVAVTGLTVLTGGIACLAFGALIGVAMNMSGASAAISHACDGIANAIFPPIIDAFITTGSLNTFTNGRPAARAAGKILPTLAGPPSPPPAASYLDMAEGFLGQLWRPTVASPEAGAVPMPLDLVMCTKHPPIPMFMAEGSSKVSINGQPAVRKGDRSTCEAAVGAVPGLISSNVRIGGGSVVVREIRSGKTPGVGLAINALLMLRGGPAKFISQLPCMIAGAAMAWGVNQVANAIRSAVNGSSNPVHAATGAKVLGGDSELDFALPGILPIDWQRTYNSRDARRNGLFGAGWSVTYEVSVEIGEDSTLTYIDEQARRVEMGVIPAPGAAYSASEGLAVRRSANGNLLVESVDGLYRLFEADPLNTRRLRLGQLGDRNANRIFLDYDERGRLLRLRDTFDQVQVELGYAPLRPERVEVIEQVFDDQRREVLARYRYDAAGDLAEVIDRSGQVQRRFAYDAGQRMVEHQLPTGLRCFYEWAQFDDGWRVVKHWTDVGDLYRFDYDVAAGLTQVTDGLKRSSLRRWNPQYQITEYTDALGHTWRFEWNQERQLLSATDPQKGLWKFAYDDSGNLSETIDPLGQTSSMVWLPHWALPEVETNAAGHSWQYRYDERGNCVAEVDPLGQITRYEYDDYGQPVRIVDASGKSKTLRWNPAGQLVEHVDCSGYPTRFSYDERGYLHEVLDALGESQRYVYDVEGRLLQSQLPDGRTEHFQRDSAGQLLAYVDPAGNNTTYQRDERGWVRQRIDAHGRKVAFDYDAYGRLQALTNENGESYRFAWDADDRLIAQQDLDQSVRHYQYDALDNVVQVNFQPSPAQPVAAPIIHGLARDALGQMLTKTTDDGQTQYAYDPLGQVLAATFTGAKGDSQTVAFAYDALGQLSSETTAAGHLNHHYDELGNLIQTELPDGRWLNRLYYGSGHLHQLNLDGQVISDFERDRLHREVVRTQGQLTTRSSYDRAGRIRSRQRSFGNQPAQLPAHARNDYRFDPSDNLVERQRSEPQQQRRELLGYDATGRIIACQEATRSETFAYDNAANLLDGQQQNAGLVRHNRLLVFEDKRYRYDGFGRLAEKRSNAHGMQVFAYDAEHRLIEVRDEHSAVKMSYDPLGRRIAKTQCDLSGRAISETTFGWDGLRLLSETRNHLTSLYLYTQNSYEPLARVDGQGEHQKIRYYHNDLNGLPELLTEADGQPVWQARYKTWGNTLEEVREAYFLEEQNLRFQGQYLDRETGLHYNTFRFYDPDVGRFTTPDPIGLAGGMNLYQYAVNPIGWVDPLGWATWQPTEVLGRKVYQNDGLIDGVTPVKDMPINQTALNSPSFEKLKGLINGGATNVDLMKQGYAPFGADGKQLNLHHVLGQEPGPMVELSASTHQKYHSQLHGLIEDGASFRNTPAVERKYNRFRSNYWKERGRGFGCG